MTKHIYTIIFVFIGISCHAQIGLECNGRDLHSIYLACSNPLSVYRIDSVDTNPTNPILLTTNLPDPNGGGISINNNLDSIAGPQTMYFVGSTNSFYFFWNGTSWTNTNNLSASLGAVNIGGSSNYIFNLDAAGNTLYRYEGLGNGTQLLSNLNSNMATIYDVATDNSGNFYLFYTNIQKIYSFNPIGMPIDTFTTTGFPPLTQPGFAILGNRMYALENTFGNNVNLYEGIQVGNNINFTFKKFIALRVTDIAACPQAGEPVSIKKNHTKEPFTVYPNPFNNEINIMIGESIGDTEVLLYDLASRVILKHSFQNSLSVNTEQLAKGIYFYEVRNRNFLLKKGKIVKE